MTMQATAPAGASDAQLTAYYEADTRYAVVPIPAPVDHKGAEEFAKPKIVRSNETVKIAKLAKLCILHDLAGTEKKWEEMLSRGGETAPLEVEKSAHAIAAVAWIGTPEQWKKADEYFKGLLGRADANESQTAMMIACAALGPDEGVANVRAWAIREADRIDKELKTPTTPRTGPAGKAAENNMIARSGLLRQFANLDVGALEKEFGLRKAITPLPKPEQAPKLAAIYCETGNESGTSIVWWAANAMVRIAPDDAAREALNAALLKIAGEHAKVDEKKQPELDATRARALRAAIYFAAAVGEADRRWLTEQRDVGTDILTLRPDWKYAAPHNHAGGA